MRDFGFLKETGENRTRGREQARSSNNSADRCRWAIPFGGISGILFVIFCEPPAAADTHGKRIPRKRAPA